LVCKIRGRRNADRIISLFLMCFLSLLSACLSENDSTKVALQDKKPEIVAVYEDVSVSYSNNETTFSNIECANGVLSFDMRTVINDPSAMMLDPYVAIDEELTCRLNRHSTRMDGDAVHLEYIIEGNADEIFIMPPAFIVDREIEQVKVELPYTRFLSADVSSKVQYKGEDWFRVTSVEKNPGGEIVIKLAGCGGAKLLPQQPLLIINENIYSGGTDFSINGFGEFDEQSVVFNVAAYDLDKLDDMVLVVDKAYEIFAADAPVRLVKK